MMAEDEVMAGTSTVLLLSDQLIEEDDDDVYMEEFEGEVEEEFECEAVAGTELDDMANSSFDYLSEADDDECDAELVEENPFEPVYPATGGLLAAEDEENVDGSDNSELLEASGKLEVQGRVLEAVSLDNILPEGSRRRRG